MLHPNPLWLIPGLPILLLGGEYLVRSSVSLARHLNLSSLVVGLVVVSFGTSAPELFVSTSAALAGHTDISLGNVVGSNISNIGLVLALTILLLPYIVNARQLVSTWAIMIAASLLLFLFVYTGNELTRWEGIILLACLAMFIIYSVIKSGREGGSGENNGEKPAYSLLLSIAIIISSSIALAAGAQMLIEGATAVAAKLNISERLISISVIAVGTSLPELATSVMAAFRKQREISIGNIIGSNIFNILAILGVTSTIRTIPVVDFKGFRIDLLWMTGFSLLLMLLILPLKGSRLGRAKGLLLVSCYIIYIYLVFFKLK